MEKVNYETESLLAGNTVSAVKTSGPATYYKGQLLGRKTADNKYYPWASSASDGTEEIRAVVAKDRTLSAEGKLSVYIIGTEVQSMGLKTNEGSSLTVTSEIIENAQNAGIIIKEY